MRSRLNGNTAAPANAFTDDYLALLNEKDEPITASEADAAGPWGVEDLPQGGHTVFRAGGDGPYAIFSRVELAQVAAAVMPGTGREKRYKLGRDEEPGRGYPITRFGETVGYVNLFDEDLVAALNVVDALLSSPNDFAWLLEAAGGLALQHVGRISMARAAAAGR